MYSLWTEISHSKSRPYEKINPAEIQEQFFMPPPERVQVIFTKSEVDKLQRIIQFSNEQNISGIELYMGCFAKDPHKFTRVFLFSGSNELGIVYYRDFGNHYFPVFCNTFFKVSYNKARNKPFQIEFLYVNSYSEFCFYSEPFELSQLVEQF